MRDGGGGAEGFLGLGRIEQISLQIEDAAAGDRRPVHVGGAEPHGSAEERAHGALRVRGDQDEAPPGGRPGGGPWGVVAHAGRAQVVTEDLSELIVAHLAHVVRAAAERRHAHHRVGRRAARDLDARAHRVVEGARPILVDEMHGPLHQALPLDQALLRLAQHVHQGVADAHHVELAASHGDACRARARPSRPGRRESNGRAAAPASCGCAPGRASDW